MIGKCLGYVYFFNSLSCFNLGGPACSQVVSKRIIRYIAASLLPKKLLEEQIRKKAKSSTFATCLHDRLEFVDEIKEIYEDSFSKYG